MVTQNQMQQPFTTSSPVAALYSYQDIADGTGVIAFDGALSATSTGDSYILTTNTLFSNDIETTGSTVAAASPTYAKSYDIDFDVVLNSPRYLKGNAKFNLTSYIQGVAGAGNVSQYLIIKVRHWNGTTETDITTVQTETHSPGAASGVKEFLVDVDITGYHFAKGDTLRITVEGWGTRANAGSTILAALGHDPMQRDTAQFPANDNYTTAAKFYIPFDIRR